MGIFVASIAVVWLSFYYGLFLGIHFGLVNAMNAEIGNLQEVDAIIKIIQSEPTEAARNEAVQEYNKALLGYLTQKRETVESMAYLDVLLSPIESLRLVCKDWYPKEIQE